MPRVNIYIPAMKLKLIDLYCKDRNVVRSQLLVNAAMSVVNSRAKIRCEFQGCARSAIGKYKLTVYSTDIGEDEKVLNLCEFHYNGAKREGVVKEIE